MFLERISRVRYTKSGAISQRPEIRYKFKCDTCSKEYEKKPNNVSVSRSGFHFCSNDCKAISFRKTGKMRSLSQATSMSRFGTSNPMSTDVVKNKHKETLQKKYGNDVTSPLHVPGAKERRKRTHLERYGSEETFQVELFRQKRNETWKNSIGIQNWISKSELRFYEILIERFGEVTQQKWVNGRPIDFYVPSIDTYIQFDGVYWHGLDRPIEEIRSSCRPRDITIYKKWLQDQEQNAWFIKHGLRLRRVTDAQSVEEQLETIVS